MKRYTLGLILLLIVGCGKKEDGLHTTYYDPDKYSFVGDTTKKEEGNYKDGKKDGKWTGWAPGEYVIWEGNYKDGKLDGLYNNFRQTSYPRGRDTLDYHPEGTYKYTDIDYVYFYGELDETGNYKDGKKDGKWIEWNEGRNGYRGDKKIKGKWYTRLGTHKDQEKANEDGSFFDAHVEVTADTFIVDGSITMGRSRHFETIVVKEPKGFTTYVRPRLGYLSPPEKVGNYKDGKKDGKWINYISKYPEKYETLFYENDKLVSRIAHYKIRPPGSGTSYDCSDSGMEKLARSRSQLLGTIEIFSDFGGGSYFVKFIKDGQRYEGFIQLKCRNGKAEVVKSDWTKS